MHNDLLDAACFGSEDRVRAMLQKHPEQINQPGFAERTPLHGALLFNAAAVVRLLLEHGADIHAKVRGRTSLHSACSSSEPDQEKVRLLLHAGADLEARNAEQDTPLLVAVKSYPESWEIDNRHSLWTAENAHKQFEAIQVLLAVGANKEARDVKGATALYAAISEHKHLVADLLLDSGSDIYARDDTGRTPLHIAAYVCEKRMLYVLLSRGADATVVDAEGRTPREVARERKCSPECFRIFDKTPRPST